MIDLDTKTIAFQCPNCDFYNEAFLKQVRIRDVIICRGCKSNIHLDDYMNQYQRARRSIKKAFRDLERTIDGMNKTLTIRF